VTILFQVIASLIISFCFGVVFHVRGKRLVLSSFSGGLGCLVYLLPMLESPAVSIFLASCAITIYAEVCARLLKTPATVFLVGGLIPLVPGGGMYHCMFELLEGNLSQAATTGYQTLLQAGAIAVGMITVSSLFKLYWELRRRAAQGHRR